jgi:Zn-dependent protease with chaperone function
VTAAPLLGLLAVTLLGPVPGALAEAAWPARAPRAAILLWQAVGLAGGLALIGTFIAIGFAPLGSDAATIAGALAKHISAGQALPRLSPVNFAALLIAVALTCWLGGNLARTAWIMERRRRQHRAVIDQLTERWLPDGSQVLADERAVAYSLPGRDWRLAVSAGALDLLTEDELAAVLTHERAHLRNRHDLVLLPFAALVRALPVPTLRSARRAVAALVEMVADDHAAAKCGRSATAAALVRMRPELEPATELAPSGAPDGRIQVRLARLTTGATITSPWVGALACMAAAALLIIPALAVL